MKIKNNSTKKPLTFYDLDTGDLFMGVPYEGYDSNEVYIKIETNFMGLDLDEGTAVRLSDGAFFEFRYESGVRKVNGTLTIEDEKE